MRVPLVSIKIPNFKNVSEPCVKMCESCAYKVAISEDEEEYELSMFVERGNTPHLCHSNHSNYCRGSWELTKRLGLVVDAFNMGLTEGVKQ